jgi:type II secretory pathway pseudopilin PulG
MKRFSTRRFRGHVPTSFTLVEVVLALGVVSFSLVAIMSMLSVGLVGEKNSNEEAAGAVVLKQIGINIRNASTNATGAYVGLGICTNLIWTLGGSSVNLDYTNLSLGGIPNQTPANQRLVAHVQLSPPGSLSSPGAAQVSIAWPQQAKWNATSLNWTNAQGSMSAYLVFLPQP